MARKYYPYQVDKQPKQVRSYVNGNFEALQKYGDVNRGAIAADIPSQHRMTAAKGKLKTAWVNSRKKAQNNKSLIRAVAKKSGAKGAKKAVLRNHYVKFGADPYHK